MNLKTYCFIVAFFILAFAGRIYADEKSPAGGSKCTDIAADFLSTTGRAPSVKSWMYQLQNASITEMKKKSFDLLVIDYSLDGSHGNAYTTKDLETLHASGKTVLAYLSVGEAEDYRYYFNGDWITYDEGSGLNQPNDKAPCWLGKTNPDWEGNYKVQYWSDDWQKLILDYLDSIIDIGFDGVYLDIIDGWEYWSDDANEESFSLSRSVAANRMINFVNRIAYYSRVIKGRTNFFIFPQNGEGILDYDLEGVYLNSISGIGIEDLYYDETSLVQILEINERISYLEAVSNDGKPVIVVDYVDDGTGYSGANQNRIDDFYSKVLVKGYYPYVGVSDRELDEINSISGLQD